MKIKTKKANINEVNWLLAKANINAGKHANDCIAKYFNEYSSLFADMQLGNGYYVWNIDDSFICLAGASDSEKLLVYSKIADIAKKLKNGVVSDTFIETVLTVPTDEYIFYKIDASSGNVDFILTGWGCATGKDTPINPYNIIQKSDNCVKFGFLLNGQLVPNREFIMTFGSVNNHTVLTTGDDGYYTYSANNSISSIKIVDVQSSKQFTLNAGEQVQMFDVTEDSTEQEDDMTDKEVKTVVFQFLKKDKCPMCGQSIRFVQSDRVLDLLTDSNGCCNFNEGQFVENSSMKIVLNSNGNEIMLNTKLDPNEYEYCVSILDGDKVGAKYIVQWFLVLLLLALTLFLGCHI